MDQRIIENIVKEKIGSRKAIIIVGARQVGKKRFWPKSLQISGFTDSKPKGGQYAPVF